MSAYGRLQQQAYDLRQRLVGLVPGARTSTLAEARASVDELLQLQRRRADILLSEWDCLEREMAQEP